MKNLNIFFKVSLVVISFLFCAHVSAQMPYPVKTLSQVNSKMPQVKVQKVVTARIIMADYALIKKDFPQTKNMTPEQIDTWFLNQAGYMHSEQSSIGSKNGVNEPIQFDAEFRDAGKPTDYRRGLIFEVPEGGLIDGKGFGTSYPSRGSHSDGLMELTEAVREFIFSKTVEKILVHSKSGVGAIGTYAVIDWGFKMRAGDQTSFNYVAGAVVRQGHRRHSGMYSLFGDSMTAYIEKVLRYYGITSAGARRDEYKHVLNIQGAEGEKYILDYGAFRVGRNFRKSSMAFYGAEDLVKMGFEPTSEVKVPFNVWSSNDPRVDIPGNDELLWLVAREAVEQIQNEKDIAKAKKIATDLYNHFVKPVEEKLKAHKMIKPVYEMIKDLGDVPEKIVGAGLCRNLFN